jgi:hypothetical protein
MERKEEKLVYLKKIDCKNYVVSVVRESVVGMGLTGEVRGKKTY